MNWNGEQKYGEAFFSLNLGDQFNQCEVEFRDGVESLQDQQSGPG